MQRKEIIELLAKAVSPGKSVWADLGSGDGAFTLGLREVGGPEIEIYSVDKDKFRLGGQEEMFAREFPDTNIHFVKADFTRSMDLPSSLDGILMANSLHFIKNKTDVLKALHWYLNPNGKLVLVEYDTDSRNFFVPYPISFKTLSEGKLASEAGFGKPEFLATVPAKYQEAIYSAVMMANPIV